MDSKAKVDKISDSPLSDAFHKINSEFTTSPVTSSTKSISKTSPTSTKSYSTSPQKILQLEHALESVNENLLKLSMTANQQVFDKQLTRQIMRTQSSNGNRLVKDILKEKKQWNALHPFSGNKENINYTNNQKKNSIDHIQHQQQQHEQHDNENRITTKKPFQTTLSTPKTILNSTIAPTPASPTINARLNPSSLSSTSSSASLTSSTPTTLQTHLKYKEELDVLREIIESKDLRLRAAESLEKSCQTSEKMMEMLRLIEENEIRTQKRNVNIKNVSTQTDDTSIINKEEEEKEKEEEEEQQQHQQDQKKEKSLSSITHPNIVDMLTLLAKSTHDLTCLITRNFNDSQESSCIINEFQSLLRNMNEQTHQVLDRLTGLMDEHEALKDQVENTRKELFQLQNQYQHQQKSAFNSTPFKSNSINSHYQTPVSKIKSHSSIVPHPIDSPPLTETDKLKVSDLDTYWNAIDHLISNIQKKKKITK